jgi:hypothetical protein
MLRMEFEPTIRVFDRAETFYILDRGATVIGRIYVHENQKNSLAFSPQANYTVRATAACRRI